MATPTLTFQVLEGVDRGRIFRGLATPVTIGREEGNLLRLNDERVSRFHAKVQSDHTDIILTDLESTNGTRVNGRVIQICRLQAGDRISLGRSMLLFGSNEEILARMADLGGLPPAAEPGKNSASRTEGSATIRAANLTMPLEQDSPFDLNPGDDITIANGNFFVGTRPLPPLPQKLSPSQAARLAEILDFLHRGLTNATENIRTAEDTSEVQLVFADWQKILGVHMLLGRYLRAISEPESLED